MKKIKSIFKILTLALITFIVCQSSSFATVDNNGPYLMLYNKGNGRSTGFYSVTTNGGAATKPVIKIVKTDSAGTKNEGYTESIYCIKDGIGFGSGTTESVVHYTNYFDLRNLDSIDSTFKYNLPTGDNYTRLIWVLDNICVPSNDTSRKELLTKAGLDDSDFAGYKVSGKTDTDVRNDIIESIQQAAIWYYTNPSGEYHPTDSPVFYYSSSNTGTPTSVSNLDSSADIVDDPVQTLYSYLVNGAKTGTAANYNLSFTKSGAKLSISGSNYLVGPYKLTGNADLISSATIKDNDGNVISNAKIIVNGAQASGSTIKDQLKASDGKEFYIQVPMTTSATSIKIDVNYSTKTLTYWSADANKVAVTQPVVIVKSESKSFSDTQNIETPEFDLALRKFIVSINGVAPTTSRVPSITDTDLKALADEDTTKTVDGKGQTTYKKHTKIPLSVNAGDKVIYTIRIYNEGNLDGKATEIADYLPKGLKLSANSTINTKYGWKADVTNSQKITTTYLSSTNLKAFNATPANGTYTISTADVMVECDVDSSVTPSTHLKNVAEITKSENSLGLKDRDSTTDNVTEKGEKYSTSTSTKGKGYEDDDDYEELLLQRFDLALRKFITGVNDEKITNREPVVDKSKFGTLVDGKEVTTCTYNHTKETVRVEHDDTVYYTIRVYNEGNQEGYASIVKDDLPEGIQFLPDNQTNKDYRWAMYDKDGKVTTDVTKADYIQTDYLSKEQEKTTGANLLKAFDVDTMDSPDYRDVVIAFKVTEPNTSDRIIINKAQVKKHTDKDGEDVTDIDSTPDKWIDGEDDQDIEKIYVKYFDLALRKWVTQAIVIEDGQEKVMDTGHKPEDEPESVVKVEVNKKRMNNTVIKFRYSIRITNEGEIAGHALEISDYIPKGLKFNQADNPQWKEVDGKIVTDQLKDTLLQPGSHADVEVLLTWVNSEDNMGVMVNTAEISEDDNDDIDSTPNNKKEGEDDIDTAPVALTVVTGKAQTFIAITSVVLLIVGSGVFFIKKFVI